MRELYLLSLQNILVLYFKVSASNSRSVGEQKSTVNHETNYHAV
jgi:hypothetical protein